MLRFKDFLNLSYAVTLYYYIMRFKVTIKYSCAVISIKCYLFNVCKTFSDTSHHSHFGIPSFTSSGSAAQITANLAAYRCGQKFLKATSFKNSASSQSFYKLRYKTEKPEFCDVPSFTCFPHNSPWTIRAKAINCISLESG